jgi:hypothetical protein
MTACTENASPTRPSSRRPLVSALSPTRGLQGSTMAVTIFGNNFSVASKATVDISGGGITVKNVVVLSAGTATALLSIAPDAVPGSRTLTIRTLGGNSDPLTFTVVDGSPQGFHTRVPHEGSTRGFKHGSSVRRFV